MNADLDKPHLPTAEVDRADNEFLMDIDTCWQEVQRGEVTKNTSLSANDMDAKDTSRGYLPILKALHRAGSTLAKSALPEQVAGTLRPSSTPEVLAADTKLGQYRILEFLGRGGMAEVYLVRHETLGTEQAMKVLPANSNNIAEALQRFNTERRAQARLEEHANIVAATDAGEDQGRQYLVMRYVGGISLKEYVERIGPLSVEETCDYVLQVAAGLKHAHWERVVHRDIKPANLLRTLDKKIRIVDWGVARILDDPPVDAGARPTQPGILLGTLDYMAPEQAQDATQADERSDLYSLGAVLHFLLIARSPSRKRPELARLQKLRPDLHPAIAQVLLTLLQEDPDKRYQSAQELIETLTEALKAPSLDATRETQKSPSLPLPSTQSSRSRSRWPFVIAVSLATLIAAGLVALLVAQWKKPEDPGAKQGKAAGPVFPGDKSKFIGETVPDGSRFRVGQKFTKTWEIQNVGIVHWKGRFLAREGPSDGPGRLNSPKRVAIPDTPPGARCTIVVEFVAPDLPGSSYAEWKMVDAEGRYLLPTQLPLSISVDIVE